MIAFAWLVLFSWPIVAIIFYRNYSLPVALCATIIGGFLLLPSGLELDLPILPALNKNSIPVLAALVLTAIHIDLRDQTYFILSGWLPRSKMILTLLAMLLAGVAGTVLTNQDVLVYGWRVLPGLQLYDAFSIVLELGMLIVPLFLARRVLASAEGQRVLLTAFVVSAAVYTIPTLYEVRMSPQLHMRVYGFFPHSFAQHMRDGGFRPVVFVGHGLGLSMYYAFAVIAAGGLWRATVGPMRQKWLFAMLWLFVILVLTKSLGPILLVVCFLPVALFLKSRSQLLIAASLAAIVLIYPVLRAGNLVPVDDMLSLAADFNAERAASLNTRIENEDILLEKANQRPAFGWGIWGRNRVFDQYGGNISITDGSWILELGLGGWFRYIPIFGLLCWPIIGLLLAKRSKLDTVCVVLALMVCLKLVDLIPNSGFPAFLWLLVGSLIGRLEMESADIKVSPVDDVAGPPDRKLVYARKLKGQGHAVPGGRSVQARVFGLDEDAIAPPTGRKSEDQRYVSLPYTRSKTTRYRS